MFAASFGKYKNIIISIALFLLLDASVLILNFYMSFQIAEDAVGVNLAGRQRMLSQRTVKSLFDLNYSMADEGAQSDALEELKATVGLFDKTLRAFDVGGVTRGADGSDVQLQAVRSLPGREAIERAKVLWKPYKASLEDLFATPDEKMPLAITATIAYAQKNNLPMLKLMNDLTVDLENVASSKATTLRTIQTVGISLAIVNFFIILFHFIGQLRDGDRKLDIARQETKKILDTVNEGLFLIDGDLVIASQYSKNVPAMFGRTEIAGMSFEVLLSNLVSAKDMETSKRFIGLLYREEIKSNLISDLNPLREIEVNIPDASGGFINRYLSFEFARAYEAGAIKNILITVNDVTDKVLLERELAQVKEQTEQHMEMLTGILHANPAALGRFVEGCFAGFERINVLLREPASSDAALREKLNEIFIEIHTFKGEAGALGLENFQDLAHKFESDITLIKGRDEIMGDDFFPLVVQLEKLIRHAETVRGLSDKLVAFGRDDGARSSGMDEWEHLQKLTQTVASRCGKDVELVTCGLTEVSLSDEHKKLVSEVSVQCIRNAIVHGIEEPLGRVANRKRQIGRIELRLIQTSGKQIEFSVSDDGQGIDYEAIRRQAAESGIYAASELQSWSQKQLVSLIFEPGFSTAGDASVDAGRGVGMDVVRERIKEFGGRIRVASRKGRNTQVTITIPQSLPQEIAA